MCIRTFNFKTELSREGAMKSIAALLREHGIKFQVTDYEIASHLIENKPLVSRFKLDREDQWTAQDYIRFEFGVSNTGGTDITVQTMQIGTFVGCFLSLLPFVFLTIVTKTALPLLMVIPIIAISWYCFHYVAVVAVRRKLREKLRIRYKYNWQLARYVLRQI